MEPQQKYRIGTVSIKILGGPKHVNPEILAMGEDRMLMKDTMAMFIIDDFSISINFRGVET